MLVVSSNRASVEVSSALYKRQCRKKDTDGNAQDERADDTRGA